MSPCSRLSVAVIAVTATGCHVTSRYQDTRRGETRHERRADPPRPGPPTVDVTDDGHLRLVEPLVCRFDTVTDLATFDVSRTRTNVATLIVGVIATAGGAVAAVAGLTSDQPASSPLSYVGSAGVVVGVPLVVGPLVGTSVSQAPAGTSQLRAPGGEERCGERPVPGGRAVLTWSGLRAIGAIDGDGRFEVSPFRFVDAFAVGELPALRVVLEVERDGGPVTVDAVIDAAALARARAGFLAAAGIDTTVETLRKVPRLEPGTLRVSQVHRDQQRGLRVVLPLANTGPGDAYQVRLQIGSTSDELDGRMIYVGRVAAHSTATVEAVLPLSNQADGAVAGGNFDLSLIIRDAHGTAPDTPVKLRGMVLRDPSR